MPDDEEGDRPWQPERLDLDEIGHHVLGAEWSPPLCLVCGRARVGHSGMGLCVECDAGLDAGEALAAWAAWERRESS